MLAKYDTSFVEGLKRAQSSFIFSVHLHPASLELSRWEKDWSLLSHSVKV